MAVIEVTEHPDGRNGSLNELQEREYTRVFTVKTSSPLDGPEVVGDAPGLPRIYEPYAPPSGETDLGCLVRQITPEPTDSPVIWKVTVKYSSAIDSLLNANPLLRPAEISYSAMGVAIPIEWDLEGKLIRNTAGEPFDPPLEIEDNRLVMRISVNRPTYDALRFLPFLGSINSKTFLGLKPYSTKCVRLDGTRQHENGKLFWRIDSEFHIRWIRKPGNTKRITPAPAGGEPPNAYRSWTAWLLNRGYNCKPLSTNGKLLPCLNAQAQPVSAPVPLAEDGTQLPFTGNPLFLGFDYLPERDFNELNLF